MAYPASGIEAYFNKILMPSVCDGRACENDKPFIPRVDGQVRIMAYLPGFYQGCKIFRIRECEDNECLRAKHILTTLAPLCLTWDGFAHWALQLAACICTKPIGHPLASVPTYILSMARSLIGDTDLNQASDSARRWAESVDLVEVLDTVLWLARMSQDVKFGTPVQLGLSEKRSELYQEGIAKAIEQATRLGLCPHRIWALLANYPEGELNLTALIPPVFSPIRVSRHIGHEDCTPDFCEDRELNFISVQSLHVCDFRTCQETFPAVPLFSQDLLIQAVSMDIPTAWSLDGCSILLPGEPYMAISHVWADGTGGRGGKVNRCLWKRFCDLAVSLNCRGIWWDAISLPSDKAARSAAINSMHRNYQYAEVTLVHDLYIQRYRWIDSDLTCADGACFAIGMSSWFTRGWTALELAKSRNVKVLFANQVVKSLDSDILASPHNPSSPCRQIVSHAIQSLRKPVDSLNQLLIALGPRHTSWSRDPAIIAGILMGVTSPDSMRLQEIYQNILKSVRKVPAQILFTGQHTMSTSGFTWCPTDLLRMPPANTHRDVSLVIKDQTVIGIKERWIVMDLQLLMNDATILWKYIPPFPQSRLRAALRAADNHVLLQLADAFPTSGIVVKLMRKQGAPVADIEWLAIDELYGQFVGSLDFVLDAGAQPSDWSLGRFDILVGDVSTAEELPNWMSTKEYLEQCADIRILNRRRDVAREIIQSRIEALKHSMPSPPSNTEERQSQIREMAEFFGWRFEEVEQRLLYSSDGLEDLQIRKILVFHWGRTEPPVAETGDGGMQMMGLSYDWQLSTVDVRLLTLAREQGFNFLEFLSSPHAMDTVIRTVTEDADDT